LVVLELPWSIQGREGMPMARQLEPEETLTFPVLEPKAQSNRPIAQVLAVSEGALGSHLRRDGQPDGRQRKPRKAEPLPEVIPGWLADNQPLADALSATLPPPDSPP
jgi:hypothetical protein